MTTRRLSMESAGASRGEHGAVIVEFAAVFVVFAMLLAGLISYGMIFAVQQSLSHATSEAARAVVGVDEADIAEAEIEAVLDSQLTWLGGLEAVDYTLPSWSCEEAPCVAEITVTYDGPYIRLFPFRVATPAHISASAALQHDVSE